MIAVVDHVDREILVQLGHDARLSYRDLGARVGLSANAAAERVRRLRRDGVITGFRATVAPDLSLLHVLVDVRLALPPDAAGFERAVAALPEVTEVVHLTGRADYQLRAACTDAAALDRLLAALKRDAGVAATETRLILRTALQRPPEPLG